MQAFDLDDCTTDGVLLEEHPMAKELHDRWDDANRSSDQYIKILEDKRMVARLIHDNIEAHHVAAKDLLFVSGAFASLVQRIFRVPMSRSAAEAARDMLVRAIDLPPELVETCINAVGRDMFESFGDDECLSLYGDDDIDVVLDECV